MCRFISPPLARAFQNLSGGVSSSPSAIQSFTASWILCFKAFALTAGSSTSPCRTLAKGCTAAFLPNALNCRGPNSDSSLLACFKTRLDFLPLPLPFLADLLNVTSAVSSSSISFSATSPGAREGVYPRPLRQRRGWGSTPLVSKTSTAAAAGIRVPKYLST